MYIIHIIAVNVALDLEAVGQLLTQGSLSMFTYKKNACNYYLNIIYMYICIFWINWIIASHLTEQPPTASLSHCFLYSLPTPMDSNGSYRALMKKAMLLGQKENFFISLFCS